MKSYDLIVVGGGPAGTTLATLVKKYNPQAKVLLLEKARFPRHHVGESLLPGMIPVLKEMGVHEKIRDSGFLIKIGATFVWGRDRTPWDADFNNLNMEMIEKYGRALDTEFSWQVKRADYDAILLQHAKDSGVEVREDARAADLIKEGEAVRGVVVEQGGKTERLDCRLLADCSGQAGFLSRYFDTRTYREDLKNVAGYAYFRGAKWKWEYQGHPDKTKIFVCSVPEGWFWYIPVAKDLVSVGLVAKAGSLKERGVKDFRAEFFRALKACPEIAPLMESAELVRGVDGEDKDFFSAGDWSFESKAARGEGWLAAGDAAFFLDPLLSSGVMMAHLSAHKAAYTISSAWREEDAAKKESLWADYDRTCREIAGSFAALVQYWYRHDPCAEAWWKAAQGALRDRAPLDLSDKMAFVTIASGLTYHFERLYTSQTLFFGNIGKEHTWQWEGTKHDLKRWTRQVLAIVETGFLALSADADPEVKEAEDFVKLEKIPEHWVPRFTVERRVETTYLPVSGTGRLYPIARVEFLRHDAKDPVASAANPKRVLPRVFLDILERVDGKRSVSEIEAEMLALSGLPADLLRGQVFRILKDLAVLGVLRFQEGGRLAAAVPPTPLRRAETALKSGQVEQAEAHLCDLLDGGQAGAWVWALRGDARRHLGRKQDALADLDQALKLAAADYGDFDGELSRGWIRDRILVLRGRLRLETGDAAGARADADAALQLNARHSEALLLRAKAARALGQAESARQDLEAALAIEDSGRKGQG